MGLSVTKLYTLLTKIYNKNNLKCQRGILKKYKKTIHFMVHSLFRLLFDIKKVYNSK